MKILSLYLRFLDVPIKAVSFLSKVRNQVNDIASPMHSDRMIRLLLLSLFPNLYHVSLDSLFTTIFSLLYFSNGSLFSGIRR